MAPAEVDLRILQANERTLLAWIRTGLALMAFGFVLARIGVWLEDAPRHGSDARFSITGGAAFIIVGTLIHPIAAIRFARARRAIVEGRPIVTGMAAALALASAVTLLGAMLVVYLFLR